MVLSSSIQSGRDALSSSTSNFASVSKAPVNASHSYHGIQGWKKGSSNLNFPLYKINIQLTIINHNWFPNQG